MSPLGKILMYVAVAGAIASLVMGGLIVEKRKEDAETLKKTQDERTLAQNQVKKTAAENAALTAAKADVDKKLADSTTQVSDLTDKLNKAQKDASDAQAALQTANDAAKTAKDQLDAITKTLNGKTADQLVADTAKAQADFAASQAEQKILQDNVTDLNAKVAQMQDAINRSLKGKILPGVTGKVTFVDRAWNFVILNVGIDAGVVPNGELIIYRGHDFLGKVRVTKVDPNDSVAEILPDAKGDIQIGDAVLN